MRRLIRCLSVAIVASLLFPFELPQSNLHSEPPVEAKELPLKDLDGHFPFEPPASLDAWKARAEVVQRQVLVSQGLWPKPNMAKPAPVVHSTRAMDGYSISKVYFESLPGFYVTGSLFLPESKEADKGKAKKRPAVLCPHGHWIDGRFYHANDNEVAQLIATGAERFESAARNHMQARCVQMARMGCVVFQYDMIGYADSQQINLDRAHLFGLKGPNPDLGADKWLLYSEKADGNLQSTMALQTINSLQAFEFLANREDVDATKIAITGASGGGTQSFIAAAVEPRIAGAFPAVMVSTGMQGGCTCENACGLRVATGNIELASLIAPRPMGLTAADDWTRTMPKDGFPELQKIYDLFGAKDRVRLYPSVHFPHNFNHVARVALYGFINQTFGLGFKEPILERDFEVLFKDDLTVWDKDHPAPVSGVEFESKMLASWKKDVDVQLGKSPELKLSGWDSILEPANGIAGKLTVSKSVATSGDTVFQIKNSADAIVGELTIPKTQNDKLPLSINLISNTNSKTASSDGGATLTVQDASGFASAAEQPRVKSPRPSASYTYGYNSPQAIRKLAVVIRALDELKAGGADTKFVLLGQNDTGFLACAAQRLRPNIAVVSEKNTPFDFATVTSVFDPMFIPGSLRYGMLK